MKYLIAIIALAFATPASANEEVTEFCSNVGDFAENVLTERYKGVSIAVSMKAIDRKIELPALASYLKALVMAAYKVPAYVTADMQAQAVMDFRNAWETGCFEAMLEDDYV